MGTTKRFSKAAGELQTAFLKPPEECTQISRDFRKAICSPHVPICRTVANTIAKSLEKSVNLRQFARGKK
jgi:phosphopantetheine adenylyltransferase